MPGGETTRRCERARTCGPESCKQEQTEQEKQSKRTREAAQGKQSSREGSARGGTDRLRVWEASTSWSSSAWPKSTGDEQCLAACNGPDRTRLRPVSASLRRSDCRAALSPEESNTYKPQHHSMFLARVAVRKRFLLGTICRGRWRTWMTLTASKSKPARCRTASRSRSTALSTIDANGTCARAWSERR
eukprot:2123034-Rhodomonas_salina.2